MCKFYVLHTFLPSEKEGFPSHTGDNRLNRINYYAIVFLWIDLCMMHGAFEVHERSTVVIQDYNFSILSTLSGQIGFVGRRTIQIPRP